MLTDCYPVSPTVLLGPRKDADRGLETLQGTEEDESSVPVQSHATLLFPPASETPDNQYASSPARQEPEPPPVTPPPDLLDPVLDTGSLMSHPGPDRPVSPVPDSVSIEEQPHDTVDPSPRRSQRANKGSPPAWLSSGEFELE